jgi:hypothetical protein
MKIIARRTWSICSASSISLAAIRAATLRSTTAMASPLYVASIVDAVRRAAG